MARSPLLRPKSVSPNPASDARTPASENLNGGFETHSKSVSQNLVSGREVSGTGSPTSKSVTSQTSPQKRSSGSQAKHVQQPDTSYSNIWRPHFSGAASFALLVFVVGILLLYVYWQVLSLIATIAAFPGWLAILSVLGLAVIVGAVLWAFARLAGTYLKFRRNRQIQLRDLERHHELREKLKLHKTGSLFAAREELEAYVRNYPLSSLRGVPQGQPAEQTTLPPNPSVTFRFSEDQSRKLKYARQELLLQGPGRIPDAQKWITVYKEEFQAILDEAARERVSQCARWVGLKTAISPNALIDILVLLYWTFVMINDLCTIYNVRAGFWGTVRLLWRILFAAYIAGQLQDWEEHIETTVESFTDQVSDWAPQFVNGLIGKVTAKGATGFTNYLVVTRIGSRAIKELQPLV